MNALADAAFMTAPEGNQGYASAAYTDGELRAMGVMGVAPAMIHPGMTAGALLAPLNGQVMGTPMPISNNHGIAPTQLAGPGRHLQILDHTVHRIDAHTKANGEEEKEMVVSNLRHFTLKIGVLDPRIDMRMGHDSELPLKVRRTRAPGTLRPPSPCAMP